jgi:tetratricopeptide (TPR) repeat protein
MRATSALLIAALVFGEVPQARAEPETESAEQLYEAGRKAYRLGRYDEAVKKFERSYELSDQPLLLYNIALSYKRLYGISKDVADLRRSKTVFEEFITVAQSDTALATEIEDARARLAEIDDEIARAESAAAARPTQPNTDVDRPPATRTRREQQMRVAGISTLAAGAALVITGVAVGTYYVIQHKSYKSKLSEEMSTPSSPESHHQELLTSHRNNLDQAKLGMGIGFGLVGGLGLIGVVAGSVLLAKSSSRGPAKQALRIAPTRSGFVVSGRF